MADAYVVSVLWRWFAVPTLGFGVLGVIQSAGLLVLARIFSVTVAKPKEVESGWPVVVGLLARPWMFLLMGWIVTWFM